LRSRTHILEEESLFELKRTLPNEWVIREKPKDYGIDVEIEIFTSKGEYTGIVFWVQLKATDSEKLKDHKSIRMTIAKIRQLASYDLPVALFRYNSNSRTFYFDWIKRHAYLSSSSEKKSFNIEFQDYHLWSKDSTSQIISFLKSKIRFSNNSFSFPIKGFLNNINAPDKTVRKLSSKISKNIALIEITRDRNLANIEINLLENRIVLNLSGSFGGSIGYKKGDLDNEELIFKAFKNCLILILFQTDKDVELFKFINDHELLDEVINHPGMLHYLMPKLIASESGNHFTEEVVEHVFKSGNPISATIIQTIIFLSSRNVISKERVESYFNQIIDLGLELENYTSLATSYYNFGGYYRGINVYDKALYYYNKAYKTENNYLKKGYFCRELGGILFELDFFRLSAKFYKKANVLEPENVFLLATIGDAEFYSGNYEKALNYFDDFLVKNANQKHDKYEFSLKFTICKALIEIIETKAQKRNPKKLLGILKNIDKKQLHNSDKLDELIEIDALNPIIWSYYSTLFLKSEDLTMLFLSSLMQAVLVRFDSKIWSYVSILTTYEGSPSGLLNDIVNTAYFYCREDFLSDLQDMIELEEYDDFKGEEFINYVEELIKTPKEYPMELRFWEEDDVKIIEL
jgi:tetratricopeptide (TPR) repeat protein